MAERTSPRNEFPKPTEKLAHKFIMDSLLRIKANSTELPTLEEGGVKISSRLADKEESAGSVSTEIPLEKKYFRIGEVATLLSVEPYVLRYWENEFPAVRPTKSGSGHRVYSRKHVETLLRIHQLLYVDKFSIKGAKKKLKEIHSSERSFVDPFKDRHLNSLKGLLEGIKDLIRTAKSNPGL